VTKQDEINLFKNFVAQLPRGAEYLRSIMGAIEGEVADAIRNDFGFIDWNERVEQQRQHKKEITDLEAKRNELAAELKKLERQRDRLRADIDDAKRLALRVYQAN
jgi:Skp family chaperone for outer membrane proteins